VPIPHKVLRETRFANERLAPIGVELLTLRQLRRRVQAQRLAEPERVEFYLILVTTGGQGKHQVDFEQFNLWPGQVVFVQPGQIQQWHLNQETQADLLLIDPVSAEPNAAMLQSDAMTQLRLSDWPHCFELDVGELATWKAASDMLRRELNRPELDALSNAMAHALLSCLMLNMRRAVARQTAAPTTQTLLFRRFRRELEEQIYARPSVAQLARSLRVSSSTLNRACHEVLGHSAKEEVDRCIVLEAQRLLVHTAATTATISEQLSFTEPTNFTKFFRRLAGMTPETFRRKHLLPSPAGS